MVRPVELQDVLAKTSAAEKITQIQRASPENDQRQALLIAGQKAHEAQHKTTPTVHPDEVILHRNPQDGNKKKPTKDERQDRKNEGGENDREHPLPGDESPLPPPELDITV